MAAAQGAHAGGGLLSVVGTPIGNLSDASPRVIETLRSSHVVLCEDTRVTGRLMSSFGLHVPLQRADENVLARRIEGVLERLEAGDHVSFVSDAGMPGVSDPGQRLVDAALDAGLRVEVIPGPSAITCALVASGLPMEHFYFEGFLPRKHGAMVARLRELAPIPGALVVYESPRRVAATLAAIAEVFPRRRAALVRELTKLHEEVLRDLAPKLAERVAERDEIKGECVVVIEGPVEGEERQAPQVSELSLDEAIVAALEAGEPKSALAKRLSRERGLARSVVYDRVVELARTVGATLLVLLALLLAAPRPVAQAAEAGLSGAELDEDADSLGGEQGGATASEVPSYDETAFSADQEPPEAPLEAQAPLDGWVRTGLAGAYRYYQNGSALVGWLVTNVTPQGVTGELQRYWLGDDGLLAQDRVISPDEGNGAWWAYARPEGYVVRGSYRKGDTVYLANNSGRMPAQEGWLVSKSYGQGLQRYYLERDEATGAHVAKVGPSAKGWAHCTRPEGYVVRGLYQEGETIYLADNEGRMPTGAGWLVSGDYSAGELQRYYLYEQVPGVCAARAGLSGDGYLHYTTSQGHVLRNVMRPLDGTWYKAGNDGLLVETVPVAITQSLRPSLCHGPKGAEFQRYIVLHDTEGSANAWNVIDGWEDSGSYVAAHFVINRDGSIVQCVPLDQIAHHAGFGDTGHNDLYGIAESSRDDHRGTVGIGSWASDYGMNAWSIGIEMVHYTGQGYPEEQLVALDGLIAYIDGSFGFESAIIDHKMWRSYNSDTSDAFAGYLANYQRTRTHDGS